MAVDRHQVRQSAKAFIEALGGMTAKQKEQPPTVQYGQEFNRLLGLAKEAVPQVDARLWPTEVGVHHPAVGGGRMCAARYVEVETYVRQIINLIPEDPLSML